MAAHCSHVLAWRAVCAADSGSRDEIVVEDTIVPAFAAAGCPIVSACGTAGRTGIATVGDGSAA